jgi:hypothetical protein
MSVNSGQWYRTLRKLNGKSSSVIFYNGLCYNHRKACRDPAERMKNYG